MRIAKWEKIVAPILENCHDTRDDDRKLYYIVLTKLGYSTEMSLKEYLLDSSSFPSYETITRVRRKIQSTRPELRGVSADARAEREEAFIEYARS